MAEIPAGADPVWQELSCLRLTPGSFLPIELRPVTGPLWCIETVLPGGLVGHEIYPQPAMRGALDAILCPADETRQLRGWLDRWVFTPRPSQPSRPSS